MAKARVKSTKKRQAKGGKRAKRAPAQGRKRRTVDARPTPKRPLRQYAGAALLASIAAVAVFAYSGYISLFSDMPTLPEKQALWEVRRQPAVEFLAADGSTLAVRGPRYGRQVRLSDLPAYVPSAFIAAEDKRFYQHNGADPAAIARALWSNWREGRTVSGASTITQQLIKNLVLSPDQSLRRKAQEVRLARTLENRLSKDEILELYLNRIYFGSGAYGLDAAAREYFGKAPEALSIAEAALLATLPKAPSRLALDNNLAGALARQAYVLAEMHEAGFITEMQRIAATNANIQLDIPPGEPDALGHALDAVSERLQRMLSDPPSDLVVTLSLDPSLQMAATAKVKTILAERGKDLKASEAAALILDRSGAVLAMVGGRDYGESQFNRVTQARRQPGSSFKAFVFAAALDAGLDPYDVRFDAPVSIGNWTPKNYTDGFFGPITLSEAFARSLNTVAAQIGHEIGEQRIISLARRFGVQSPLRPLPSIALGSQETTLYEMTRAFGAFAKGGERLDPYMILKVEDSRGNLLFQRPSYQPLRVYPEALARKMNAMLARAVTSGTGSASQIEGWTVAGKTGTSQDWRDAWFIGFTAKRIGGVWVGNDDDSPMAKVTGGGLPAEIWAELMQDAHKGEVGIPLAGTEAGVFAPSIAAEERIAFYRGLAGAFGVVEGRQVADLEGGQNRQ